ncbi:MAG TPA: malonic semialdehyde reductase [Acidobacteriaceae bacterium]|nr:malonic semialdehyde reductase [Acidobacteriaceae bacterium]
MSNSTKTLQPLPEAALDQLFRSARTYSAWLPKPVPIEVLRELYELASLGPTSANSSPARFVFVTTPEGKQRLKPALAPGNVDKTMAAPVTAIVANDMEFYEHLPRLFPQAEMKQYFVGKPAVVDQHVLRNGSLSGAYLILAARALGLDCGPMSGFDAEKVNAEFFPDGKWKANFLVNLGYGDATKLHPRNPRLDWDEAVKVV